MLNRIPLESIRNKILKRFPLKSEISTDSSRIDCQFCGVEVSKKSIRRHEVYKQCLQNWERQPTENNQKRSEDILVPPISKQERMFSSRDRFADYVYLTKKWAKMQTYCRKEKNRIDNYYQKPQNSSFPMVYHTWVYDNFEFLIFFNLLHKWPKF